MDPCYPRREYYKNEEIAETYDAGRFHSLAGRADDWLDKRSLHRALAFLSPGSSVLDVACGTGRITEFLAQHGFQVWGADISEEMLQVAQRRLSDIEGFRGVRQADAEKLPFTDDQFDGTVSMRFFGHVPPNIRIAILSEMKRVSKRCVIVQYPLSHRMASFPAVLRKMLFPKSSRSALTLPSRQEAGAELRAAGLEIQAMFPKLSYCLHSWVIVASSSQHSQTIVA